MIISFLTVTDLLKEVQHRTAEIEQANGIQPTVRVQEYANHTPRQGSVLITFFVDVAAKNVHGDVLLCRIRVGAVDYWGKDFPSETDRLALVKATDDEVKDATELFKKVGCDVRDGRYAADPKDIILVSV